MQKRGIFLIAGTVTMSIILSGCFQGEQSLEEEMIDPPQNAEPVDNLEDSDAKANEQSEDEDNVSGTIARDLYLIDANGMVASQTLELPTPESNKVATQVLEYLVKGGPISQLLPNGFQAVLPEGTEVLGINLQEDGTMVVNFSKEFANYEAKDETKVLEAVTYTLTQFENVEEVQLQMDGMALKEMPVNGTPIGEGYSRENGINVSDTGVSDFMQSKTVTMYYPTEHDENRYYIPVTQYVEPSEEVDEFSAIVKNLLKGPGIQSNVKQVFNDSAALTSKPSLKDGVLQLHFNESILKEQDKSVIADEVMETLVRTLTNVQGVEAVQVNVESVEELVNENGEAYTEPVTKQQFIPTEKL
nr:GerMN domain-containing protein [Priestia megaterium]